MTPAADDRELPADLSDPLGLEGIEFIEYATARPQALGQALERMGFQPVARHRSREVLLYRQGAMNVVVNASPEAAGAPGAAAEGAEPADEPVVAAIALRVRDASQAYARALELGAWPVPTKVEVMELNIPAIHGVGGSRIYFVDRHREFSIYDVDFTPIPGVDRQPPALAGLHWFGFVQYIGNDRTADWVAFYGTLFGFRELPEDVRFGVMPTGTLLAGPPGAGFYIQLVEPQYPIVDFEGREWIVRMGLGTPDVRACVAALRANGVVFEDTQAVHVEDRGALTRPQGHAPAFELVRDAGGSQP
jgi:4-hydroxyphenylpyruvate dioxygenase